MTNVGSAPWPIEDADDDGSSGDFLGLPPAMPVNASASLRGPNDRNLDHELSRKRFANGPAAHDAASQLHNALGLLPPAAVSAHWDRYKIRTLDHRFDERRAFRT